MKKDFIWKFVSKDKLRKPLQGIYMDAKHEIAVATDAHILLTSKSLYDPNMATKVVFKNGDSEICRYPVWVNCLPKEDDDRFDLNIINNADKLIKCASVIANLKAFNGCPIGVKLSASHAIWVDCKYGKLMKQLGLDDWRCGKEGWEVLSKTTSDGIMLVMPLCVEDETVSYIPELMECGIAVPCKYTTQNEQTKVIQIAIDNGIINDK